MRLLPTTTLATALALAGTVSPASAGQVLLKCNHEYVNRNNNEGLVTASVLEPGATAVTVVCEYRALSPTGPDVASFPERLTGPVGATAWRIPWRGIPAGTRMYACTYTVTEPGNVRQDYGACEFDFIMA